MQLNSFLKFGSLAFDVANDEKVRSLAEMVHKGGRRRGLWGVAPPQPNQPGLQGTAHQHWPKVSQPIPFAPGSQAPAAEPKPQSTSQPASAAKPPAQVPQGIDLKQWVNMDSAKKVLEWANTLNGFLNK